jgi:2-polyprenyl-6-methoxyphenol hydroxylase-like FAD-dependent oxidoreductase
LQQVLLAGAAAVSFRLGTAVTSLIQDKERVKVGLSDGSTAYYDLVIGADGVHSTVRRLVLDASTPEYSGLTMWRSVVPVRPHGMTNQQILLGDRRVFGLVSVGDNHTYGFGGAFVPPSDDQLHGRLERVRKRFADFGGPVQEYLRALTRDEQLHCGQVEMVKNDRWHSGRVVLIGDAAHAGSPTMQEGGCMSMEDAYVLAEVLRGADTLEQALDAYIARRKSRIECVQQGSHAVAEMLVLPPDIRNATLRAAGDSEVRDHYRPLVPAP